jgi:RNA polymerase sigma-70 factor (ECF subfamily)
VSELGARFPAVLRDAAAGDRDAFAQLWRSTHPRLLRYLYAVCGERAEDVASDTWLKVMRNLASFSGDELAFRGWLVVIGRNTAIDSGRQSARRRELLADTVPEPVGATAPDAADEALQAISTQAALDLVSTLPPAVAEMVLLRVVVGLDVAQVAELTGRSSGAIRVAVHRGLKALAHRLAASELSSAPSPEPSSAVAPQPPPMGRL